MEQECYSAEDTEKVICSFTIKGAFYKENCLPSLNDLLAEAERHPTAYGKMKRDMEWVVSCAIRRDLKGWKANGPVRLDIEWGEKEKGRRRDYDNIVAAGRKIINDALTKTKTIVDDDPTHLGYGSNTFTYTDKVFVKVSIIKMERF